MLDACFCNRVWAEQTMDFNLITPLLELFFVFLVYGSIDLVYMLMSGVIIIKLQCYSLSIYIGHPERDALFYGGNYDKKYEYI